MTDKPILCLDFDGVVHRYSKGWQDGSIYDPPTDGFAQWAERAKELFKLVIYSSRSKELDSTNEMAVWMHMHGINSAWFEFAHEKPPAFLTIDDRCVRFMGDWSALDPAMLRDFKPWNYHGPEPKKSQAPFRIGGGVA